MTKKEVSVIQNRWNDSQKVSQGDMETEQAHNEGINAAIVQNHFGSGVLLDNPEQIVIFDSDALDATQAALLAADNFDGTGLAVHTQPSDVNLGNQLEVELTESTVFGRKSVKVAIIGLTFDGTTQIDRFYFHKNGKQVTSNHYKRILCIITNDFKGNNNCSRDQGGHLVIRETASFQLSKDPIMSSQDVEPDIFWRDFKIADSFSTLRETVQTGMGAEYSFDSLNINTYGKFNRELAASDVTSQVGQKFQAKTNNIQKITLLLGAEKDTDAIEAEQFDWSGDLVVSIYPLQTTVVSPSDIVPELAIDFDPASVPLAQLSYNQSTLQDYGYVLTDVVQPVDFVFSSTAVGSVSNGGVIEVDKFYAVTLRRSGANNSGKILIAQGNNQTEESHLTLFNNVWVDVPEDDLWFQVWTDAAKIADGQGYDDGSGMLYPKTIIDSETGAVIDYQAKAFPFKSTGEGIINVGVLEAVLEESNVVQNERTGNPVNSRKKYVPSFGFVTESELADLKEISDPLIIGCIVDRNPKINPTLEKTQSLPGLVRDDEFIIVNPDADILSLNLVGSNIIPDSTCCSDSYKIFKVTKCIDGYGDVNGDGTIDTDDIVLATTLIGESIYYPSSQQKILDGYFDTLQLLRADVDGDGYVTAEDVDLITNYVNRSINSFPIGSYFTHITLKVDQPVGRWDGYFDCDGYVRLDGYIGDNLIDPSTLSSDALLYDGYLVPPQLELHTDYTVVPFVPIVYRIVFHPFWQSYLLAESSDARHVSASFTFDTKVPDRDCTVPTTFNCEDLADSTPACDPGRNDFYVPDNLYIGRGEILRNDGSNYKVDFEIGTVILQLPANPLSESAINIFDKFVCDRGLGFTNGSFPAMRYSDCTTVQPEDLALGKVRFNVSIQSFAPNLDGYSELDGYGVVVDDIIGVHLDTITGILKLTIKDLAVDEVYKTLVTKIQIIVYLKKAGWNNSVLVVESDKVAGLISS